MLVFTIALAAIYPLDILNTFSPTRHDVFIQSSTVSSLMVNWTSYEHPDTSRLENDSILIGNRIQLKITSGISGIPELEIANITVKLNETGIFRNQTTLGNTANFTLPWLSYNYTSEIHISAFTQNGTKYSKYYENVTILNTFIPRLSSIDVTSEGWTQTIAWTTTDSNVDDMMHSSVYLSVDCGDTYLLMARELNTSSWVWDAAGFALNREYMALIRVTDSVGLQAELESYPFRIAMESTYPPISLTLDGSSPIEIIEGSNDTIIKWMVSNAWSGSYEIFRDGVSIESGLFSGTTVTYRLRYLAIGEYNFTLQVSSGLRVAWSQPVEVIVRKDYTMTYISLGIGICIGCCIGIGALAVVKWSLRNE